MKTTYRPMTNREAVELGGFVSPMTTALRVALFLFAVAGVAWILRGLQGLVGELTGNPIGAPLWLLAGLILGWLLYRRAGRWTGGRAFRESVRSDLARGEVAEHRVRAVRALEAPEVEDEGPVFFVLDEDGTTLFFAGQEMARYKSQGFPWNEFSVQETPESRSLFRLRRLGDSLSNVERRKALTLAEGRELGVFAAPFGRLEEPLEDLMGQAESAESATGGHGEG